MDYVTIILISILLGIGFCLGPLHMILVYTYCTVRLRSSKYGYLELRASFNSSGFMEAQFQEEMS